jgi:hypothetical protein
MVLIENENVVQALGSDGSHPALGYGIGSRRPEWCANLGNTNIAHPTIECGTVTAVAVMNKKSWRLAIPSAAFDHLLSRPWGGGIRRYVNVDNLPAGMMDHEKHVQQSERDRSDAEEIARPDLWAVLPQEWPPSGGRPATMCSLHILGDCSRRNFEPKARQLRLDPPLTPKSIFRGHSADKGPKFHRNWAAAWPPCGAAWTPAPIRAPTLAVPAQHRFRPYNEERGLPAAEPATRQNPETSVHILKARPWLAALQNYQLLAEAKIVCDQKCLWLNSRSKHP